MAVTFKSPLYETVSRTATDYWNDSCSVEELTYAIENGALGATTNPTIVGEVLKRELPVWRDRITTLIAEHPTWTEDQLAWRVNEEMAVRGAEMLRPLFEREQNGKGRLSIQTDPKLYRDPERLLEQALHFATLAPNIQVKLPATKAGIEAIEEATAAGVTINATVCFAVPQALAAAEAVERGLTRRAAEGGDISLMTPVVTMMVGRLDDWLQVLVKRDGIVASPGCVHWAGIACLKRAYSIFQEHVYRARLLAAAYRHHLHWSELIGGDIVLTIPYAWQRLFDQSDVPVVERFEDPVPEEIVSELYARFTDFRRAYDPDGMGIDESL